MDEYEIEFYEKIGGECPVAEFLDSLDEKMFAKVARNIDILKIHNIKLREPLLKSIDDVIFELRTQIGKKIILTNGFIKKTQKTPRKYIDMAIEYKKDYLSR